MRGEQNEFALYLDSEPDGTQPAAAFGDAVTPAQNAYGAWQQLFSGAQITDTAYEVAVNINDVAGGGGTSREGLVTIGIDLAGGSNYSPFIEHLVAGQATQYDDPCGVWYVFPVLVPAGASLAARASVSTVDVTAVRVRAVLSCQPTRPDLIRCGTFVRTFGANPAGSNGTAITAGTASEGAWTQIGSALAEELWFWEWGMSFTDAALSAGVYHVDVAVGDSGTKRIAVQNAFLGSQTTESLTKGPRQGGARKAIAGEFAYARAQALNGNSGVTMALYGVGGDAMPATSGPFVGGAVNEWGSIIDSFADGSQPTNAGTGTLLGAIAAANTYTSYVQLLAGAAVTQDAYEVWIHVSRVGVSLVARDAILTIGIDPAGGTAYQDFISHLPIACASGMTGGGGVWYRFPVYIKAGTSIAAKWSCNDSTVNVTQAVGRVILFCQPTRPDLLRCGTFVRTFGATPATSSGTTITPGQASDGALVQLGSSLTEKLWAWQVGLGINNAAMNNRSYFIDVLVGNGITNRRAIQNELVASDSTETITKHAGAIWYREAVAGENVYGRAQCASTPDAVASLIALGVGGQAPGTGGGQVWDATAPVVTLVSPAEGSEIDPYADIVLDVTDNGGFRRIFLYVEQGIDWDVVHNGDSFAPEFSGSTRAPISGGWRYTISRGGRWRSGALAFKAYAIDQQGNEAA